MRRGAQRIGTPSDKTSSHSTAAANLAVKDGSTATAGGQALFMCLVTLAATIESKELVLCGHPLPQHTIYI